MKMQNPSISNRDHDYGEVNLDTRTYDELSRHACEDNVDSVTKTIKSISFAGKDAFGGQIKDINELKKITPRVKLLPQDASSLNELTKLHNKSAQSTSPILERTKQKLKKYCRTCAGLKLPLVDIFSEKGIQMRLNQQLKHLEDINPQDSLSTQMCMDCICDLKMSYKFFMQIKKAEVKLKSIRVKLNDKVMKDDELDLHRIATNSLDEDSRSADPVECNKNLVSKSSNNSTGEQTSLLQMPTSIAAFDDTVRESETYSDVNKQIESEVKVYEEIKAGHRSDDNESIEEFDPDDPPFQPDSSDIAESEEEMDHSQSRLARKRLSQRNENATKPINLAVLSTNINLPLHLHNSANRTDSIQTVYKYDMALNAYVRVDPVDKSNVESSIATKQSVSDSDNAKEFAKAPNILKRRLLQPLPVRKESTETSESNTTETGVGPKEPRIQKLDLQNPLSVNNPQEDGIMYVTVKGSKPNELLLVKVKKMDKPIEKKDEKSIGRKATDNNKLVEKSATTERTRKSDSREQEIEEQIEEYKKKREKILGGQNNSVKMDTVQACIVGKSEGTSNHQKTEENSPATKEKPEILEKPEKPEGDNTDEGEDTVAMEQLESTGVMEGEREEIVQEAVYDNTKEYLSRLAKLKLKWEEARKKKETLQKELDESYTEGNIQKLARILGEKEKNLHDFQDYLKQRKIVIARLKDEDIISLYVDRNTAILRKHLPDLIDEAQPFDYIPEENYLECDYCPATFSSKDILEEHLRIHDYKIMHYCEDCMEEFPTNKAKRNHNIMCIRKLICKYCELVLDSKGKKRQHEQKHCDNMYGQLCDVCGEKFKHQGTLDQHIKTQHMSWEKIFQCPKCPKKFAFKQKLSFHLKSVHTTMRAYLCEDCGADFKNPASLRHHRIRKHQPVGNKRECPVCHKLVPFYSLSKHMHTHKAYTIQCPHCDKMFKNTSTLKQHIRIHEDQRQYRCDTCGVGFNRRDGLRLHMKVHEKTDSRGLKECSCQVCGEKFPNHSTLVIHRNRVHKDGRQYTCHICNRSMISTRSLEWHMSHIHNESLPGVVKEEMEGVTTEKRRVSCYHCNKTFKTEMILRAHIKNTHMEKDPMKCLDCELTFTSEVRLRHHMMVEHNRLEGTLPCPHCPKRFVNQLRLKTHMISHSEERPYTCEICGFNLKTKIQLIKHHQNRHSDERPLQCRYCPWRCKQVSALVCHERTHTNERPYSCSVCRQRFKYLGDKNKHERRHESLGGSGFKRIVPGRNIKQKVQEEDSTTCSEQDQDEAKTVGCLSGERYYEERSDREYEQEGIVKFEAQEMAEEEYEEVYKQEYEETSREASEAAEVIMNMEDTTVYTEEVTADNIESAEIMANEILQSGTVVHLQQQDDSGKIQVIPVMLSLPDLSDTNAEVNLATASIMYNN